MPTIRDGAVPSASSIPNSCVRSNVDINAVFATPAAAATNTSTSTKTHITCTSFTRSLIAGAAVSQSSTSTPASSGRRPTLAASGVGPRRVARVDHQLVRFVVHREQLLRVGERHDDRLAVHHVDGGVEEPGHGEQVVGERPVHALPDQRDLRALPYAHLLGEQPAHQHPPAPDRRRHAVEQAQRTRRLRDVDADHDDGEAFLPERGQRRRVHADVHARDVRIAAQRRDDARDVRHRLVHRARPAPVGGVRLDVAHHRSGDRVDHPVGLPPQEAVVQQHEGHRQRDRDEREARAPRIAPQVPPGDAPGRRHRDAHDHFPRSRRDRLNVSSGIATSNCMSR